MRKIYELEDLDCANCAAKMEAAINKLPEVEKATITFLTARMTLVLPDDADVPQVLKKVQQEISKIESECRVIVK